MTHLSTEGTQRKPQKGLVVPLQEEDPAAAAAAAGWGKAATAAVAGGDAAPVAAGGLMSQAASKLEEKGKWLGALAAGDAAPAPASASMSPAAAKLAAAKIALAEAEAEVYAEAKAEAEMAAKEAVAPSAEELVDSAADTAGGVVKKKHSTDVGCPPPPPPPPPSPPSRLCMSIHSEGRPCGLVRSRFECLLSMTLPPGVHRDADGQLRPGGVGGSEGGQGEGCGRQHRGGSPRRVGCGGDQLHRRALRRSAGDGASVRDCGQRHRRSHHCGRAVQVQGISLQVEPMKSMLKPPVIQCFSPKHHKQMSIVLSIPRCAPTLRIRKSSHRRG